jgi:hypothetical protein
LPDDVPGGGRGKEEPREQPVNGEEQDTPELAGAAAREWRQGGGNQKIMHLRNKLEYAVFFRNPENILQFLFYRAWNC